MAARARISVLGAGLMGHGIAQVFALAGHEVAIYDPVAASLDQLRTRIVANLRALGTHWWNPPYLVPLVEVIGTQWTEPSAIDFTMRLHAVAGKKPAHVKKD